MKNKKLIVSQIWPGFILLMLVIGLPGCQKMGEESFHRQLQNVLDQGVKDHHLVGATASVIVPGEEIWQGAGGFSAKTNAAFMKPEMLMGIGSITKTFTAALVLKLVEEQKLSLEDRVDNWLEAYPNIAGSITIRQLLNHTSGIFSFEEHPAFKDAIRSDLNKFWPPEEILRDFVDSPYFTPGAGFRYSNTNYLLLGMIIRKTTAEKLCTLYRKYFFSPLNLNSIFLEIEETARGEIAHGWFDMDGDGILDDAFPPWIAVYSSIWSSGALFSRADDLSKWLEDLFQGRVISQNSLNEMLNFSPQSNNQYGLGIFKISLLGRELWGHDGATIEYNSLALYDPSAKICISLLINQDIDANPQAAGMIVTELLETALKRINQM